MSAELIPGRVDELAPGVARLIAPNAGVMTGPGTNTYLLGRDRSIVVDPGPAMAGHLANIRAASSDIRCILVTHTHPDHSPAAGRLARSTGAEVIGMQAPEGPHQDRDFAPAREPVDGETLGSGESQLRVIHTPGHASNHCCFLLQECGWLITGDHIIDGSTVVIDPPDGDMSAYLQSLERLASLDLLAILPGHGDVIRNPQDAIRKLIAHRLAREASICEALADNPGSSAAALVVIVYADVDQSLHALAERSLLAHLLKLQQESRARSRDGGWSAID